MQKNPSWRAFLLHFLGDAMPFQNLTRPRTGMGFRGPRQTSEFGNHSWLVNQLISAGQGALDSATWGLSDRAYAGARALMDAAHGQSLHDAYANRMVQERARDAYYAQHYGTARTGGEIAGALLPIPGAGQIGVAARLIGRTAKFAKFGKALARAERVGKRISEVSPLIGRERVAVSGAGAAAGAGGQLYSDAMTGHRSSLGDYLGAMGGGAVQAHMALHLRPKWAGAGGGAATSMFQDVLNGRPVSLVNAAQAGEAGWMAGAIGDAIGRGRFYQGVSHEKGSVGKRVVYNNRDKEKMGEAFSKFRTLANFDLTALTEKRKLPLDSGSHTFPDQITRAMQYIESKAGIWARLSKAQQEARKQAGLNYRVDHLLPDDVGSLFGFLGAQGAYRLPAYLQQDQDPQSR